MANVRSGNTYYIDTIYASSVATTTELTVQDARVHSIIFSATGTNAHVVLQDNGVTKLDIRLPNSHEIYQLRFESMPIRFGKSIRASTLTNAVVTLVFDEAKH